MNIDKFKKRFSDEDSCRHFFESVILNNSCKSEIFHITLDGVEEVHDKRRGAGTFRKIIENLSTIAESDMNAFYEVRCNVDRQNAENINQLIDFLSGLGVKS